MSQAQFVNDGSFSNAAQNGPWSYRYPFADKGDMTSFVAVRKMRVDADSFTPPTPMSSLTFAGKGLAYLVAISEPSEVQVGSALLEYEEQWASVPLTRLEYGSTTFTQIIGYSGDNITQLNATFDGLRIYEYEKAPDTLSTWPRFVTTPSAGNIIIPPITTMPTLTAPKIVQLGAGVFYVTALTAAEIVAQGVPILAEDTTTEIYMGRILCRKSIYVQKKTLTIV